MLGFITAEFFANENDGILTVEFGILSGILQVEVSVELSFSDDTALSK